MPIKINPTTWKTIAKDDPKDKLEVIIGDDKQEDFYPQVKIKRWDNECNFSVRLSEDEGTFKKVGEKVNWKKDDLEVNFFETTNAYKFDYIIKTKPVTNKIEFSIQSKDVKFIYQPPLTQQEIKEGYIRPENIVGSYAVYHSTKGGINDINGKDYKVGKLGHIYRPRLIDSNNWEVWGDLHIENGIYEVTIPEDFYNNAVYPIRSNDTFGYESDGGSEINMSYRQTDAKRYARRRGYSTSSTGAGTLDKISAYLTSTDATETADTAVIMCLKDDPSANNHDAIAILETTGLSYTSSSTLYEFTAASEAVAVDDYVLSVLGDADDMDANSDYLNVRYDTGAEIVNYFEGSADNGYTTLRDEDPWTVTGGAGTYWYSIFATYTPAAGDQTVSVPTNKAVINGLIPTISTIQDSSVSVPTGKNVFNGLTPTAEAKSTVSSALGKLVLVGLIPTIAIIQSQSVDIPTGNAVLNGLTPTISISQSYNISVPTGKTVVNGLLPSPTVETKIDGVLGNVVVNGLLPTISVTALDQNIDVPTGNVVVSGNVPTIAIKVQTITIPTGKTVINGPLPTITTAQGDIVNVTLGKVVINGLIPTIATRVQTVSIPTAKAVVNGLLPSPTVNTEIEGVLGNVVVNGLVPTISIYQDYSIDIGTGNVVFNGLVPSISVPGTGTNMKINIGDVFKDVDSLKINIGDDWKTVIAVQQNVGDSWKTVF